MNYPDRQTQVHLKPDDLDGIGASLRTIYRVADDGRFDALLRDLDSASAGSEPCEHTGRADDRWPR